MSPDRREPDRAGEVSQSLLLWLVPSPRAATLLAHLIVVGTVLVFLAREHRRRSPEIAAAAQRP